MDQMLYNGTFYTMDEANPTAEAVLVRDGVIAAAGPKEKVEAAAQLDTEKIDLQGAVVYPGLIDSHLHILNLAITSQELVLNDCRSRKAAIEAIREQVKRYPAGSFVDGRGFNEDLWSDRRLITRAELDEIAPEHAVCLTRVCGHMMIANSKALEKLEITEQTPVPDGGEIIFEKGIFNENAINLLLDRHENLTVDRCKELLYRGMCMAADSGLTGIWSDDIGTGGFDMKTVVQAYQELEKEGRMPVRVVQQCALPTDEDWAEYLAAGYHYGYGHGLYTLGPRKLYSDGSLGARTAWLSRPYADAPERTGVPIYTQEELNRLGAQAHAAGVPFIVHAIGDAGAECVLNAIEYARKTVPGTDHLPSGIVHCQITTPEQLKRIAEMNVYVYAQPVFAEYDLHICRDRVGEEMEKSSYNWATLLHSGVCISSGSDCPVEPLDPAKNIYCAVTRKDFDHLPENGWMPEQCLTVEEAVYCHTVQAAKAVNMEHCLGRIKPGYAADLSIFPKDFSCIPADEILEQKPLMTMVAGKLRRCP